jgi:superfamily II DNA or RNA helicase
VLWLFHRAELIDQAVEALAKVAVGRCCSMRIGRFQAGERKNRERVDVTVASIPTIARKGSLERLLRTQERFDLVVVDECHHSVATTWRNLVDALRVQFLAVRILGLSATPYRQELKEDFALRRMFGQHVIHEVSATELIESQVLSVPLFVEVATGELMDFAGAIADAETGLDFSGNQLRAIADRHARNKLMVDMYLAHRHDYGPTILFACTVRQCEQIASMLRSAGVACAAVHGDTKRLKLRERRAAIDDYRAGKVKVLVTAMLLTEGADLPQTRTVLMARPTRSTILFRQMVGRGLRGLRVGGTAECNVVLFQDTFIDHAADSLSARLQWMAGLDSLSLLVQRIDAQEVSKRARKARREDPELVAARERRCREVEERVLQHVAKSGLIAVDEDRRLDGWWELRLRVADPPIVLPLFRGFQGLTELLSWVCESIRVGGEVPADGWHSPFRFDSSSISLHALAFARTALRHRVEPIWVDIGAADEANVSRLVDPAYLPDYQDAYRSFGRELVQKDMMLFIRRCARASIDWSASDASVWKRHVTSSETWGRFLSRAEEFFESDERQALVKSARAEFLATRPDGD